MDIVTATSGTGNLFIQYINKFNAQNLKISLKVNTDFLDRFSIIDKTKLSIN